jgi:hypothetical protein
MNYKNYILGWISGFVTEISIGERTALAKRGVLTHCQCTHREASAVRFALRACILIEYN